MESDHNDPQPAAPDNQAGPSSPTVAARSYECSFCRRGFSNAQALGGHMNIHRKDRAKLKQSYSIRRPSPPFELSGLVTVIPSHPPAPMNHTPQRPRPQLPLFLEVPSCDVDRRSDGVVQPAVGLLKAEELDLELRLGFEPPDASTMSSSSSTTTTLKEFV